MPNMITVTMMAQDIVLKRTMRWYQDLLDDVAATGQQEQPKKRQAYEAVAMAPMDAQPALRQMFDALYGPGEWTRQQTLHLGRLARQGIQPTENVGGGA